MNRKQYLTVILLIIGLISLGIRGESYPWYHNLVAIVALSGLYGLDYKDQSIVDDENKPQQLNDKLILGLAAVNISVCLVIYYLSKDVRLASTLLIIMVVLTTSLVLLRGGADHKSHRKNKVNWLNILKLPLAGTYLFVMWSNPGTPWYLTAGIISVILTLFTVIMKAQGHFSYKQRNNK